MEWFVTKLRHFLTPEDAATPTEYILGSVVIAFLGYVAYRVLGDGLF